MSDFESSLQKWLLIFIVGIAITVSAMNYWYKTLPERMARESAGQAPVVRTPRDKTRAVEAPTAAVPVVEAPQPREVEVDIPYLALADGRTLGFSTTRSPFGNNDLWHKTEIIHPWLQAEATQEKIHLPVIPSHREAFTPIQLQDGRLVLIGGKTPRDMVALESKCADCPDEYIPFGEATPSRTTDVFDFESGAWSMGPAAHDPGTTAIRLRDGRVLQVGLVSIPNSEQWDVRVEIADSAFTHWEQSGEAHLDFWLSDVRIFESRNGAVILLARNGTQRAFHWTPRGKLNPWLEGESWIEVEQLDEGHLQLTPRTADAQPSKQKIVELP